MKKEYDARVKEKVAKCKDCKWSVRSDKYSIVCVHPIWKETDTWGGCSCRLGLSTTACLKFESK